MASMLFKAASKAGMSAILPGGDILSELLKLLEKKIQPSDELIELYLKLLTLQLSEKVKEAEKIAAFAEQTDEEKRAREEKESKEEALRKKEQEEARTKEKKETPIKEERKKEEPIKKGGRKRTRHKRRHKRTRRTRASLR
jgi:hypothetical protein